MASGTLSIRVLGDASNFQKTMGNVQSGLGKFAKVAGAAALGAGAALGGAAVAGLKSFSDLQSGMNEVFTLLPGISQKAMGDMTGQVKDFSKEFGVLPNDVVPALYQSLSAGVPANNVFEFMETAQKAAKGGVTELATAVDGISSVVNAYGSDVIDATKASDLMFTAVRLGKTDFSQLSASLYNVTPVASALGVKFEDVTASLAALTAKGVPTAQATTQIRAALAELGKGGTKAFDAFKEASGKTFPQFVQEGGNLQQAFQVIEKAAADSGKSALDMFGSVEAGQAVLALTGDGTEAFTNALEQMGSSAGATDAAFQTMEQGIGPAIEKIKAAGMVMLIDFGEKLAPTFQAFADWVVQNMPAIQEKVGRVFGYVGDVITNVVVPAVHTAQGVFQVLSAWWDDNGPAIVTRVQEIAAAISEWVHGALATLQQWWADNGPQIIDAIQRIAVIVRDVLVAAFTQLSDWWSRHGPVITTTATTMANGIGGAFQALATAAETVRNAWNGVGPVMQGIAAFIVGVMIPHWVALAVASVKSSVTQVASWVKTQVAAARSAVVHSINVVKMVASWVSLGSTAVGVAALNVKAWVSTQIAAVKAAAVHVAQVGAQVAKWVFLGAQSLLHAGKVAAAWLIAMGPIGLVTAAVVAVVALIVANWDTISAKTRQLWETVKVLTSAAWTGLRNMVSSGVDAVTSLMSGLPRRILSALGNLGSLLTGSGSDLLLGLARGITGAIGRVVDSAVRAARAVVNGVKGALGIRSPSKVFAEIGKMTGAGWIEGMQRMARPMEQAMVGALPDGRTTRLGVDAGLTAARRGRGVPQMAAIAPGRSTAPQHFHLEIGGREVAEFVLDYAGLRQIRPAARAR